MIEVLDVAEAMVRKDLDVFMSMSKIRSYANL